MKAATLSSFILSAAVLARAAVTPSEPGPGSVYRAGSTCTVSWDGDEDSNTEWKDMTIQLMTGSNYDMVHITTVATGQDGTISGRFNYPCPEMDPYSAIYFYQFTSPLATEKTWTTRFTIASPDGETTAPSNPNQPGTNDPIPWGTGALADPSTAVPPPPAAGNTPASTRTSSSSAATPSVASAPGSAPGTAGRTSTFQPSNTTATKNTAAGASETPESGAAALGAGRGAVVGSLVALASVAYALVL